MTQIRRRGLAGLLFLSAALAGPGFVRAQAPAAAAPAAPAPLSEDALRSRLAKCTEVHRDLSRQIALRERDLERDNPEVRRQRREIQSKIAELRAGIAKLEDEAVQVMRDADADLAEMYDRRQANRLEMQEGRNQLYEIRRPPAAPAPPPPPAGPRRPLPAPPPPPENR